MVLDRKVIVDPVESTNIIPFKVIIPIKYKKASPIPTPKPMFRYVELPPVTVSKKVIERVPGDALIIKPDGISDDQFINSEEVPQEPPIYTM